MMTMRDSGKSLGKSGTGVSPVTKHGRDAHATIQAHPTDPSASMTARMHGARWTDVVVVVLLAISLIVAVGMVKGRSLHGNDYKHLWAGAWLLAHDQDPYDEALLRGVAWRFRIDRAHPNQPRINPYVYLPTTGLLMRPLAGMPYRRSQVAWHWMNWLLAWTLAIAGPSLMGVARPARARLAGACFLVAAMPFFRQMSAGQMNVVTAALIVAAVWALRRRRATILGLLLALGTAWKIAPVILLAALTAMRRWRAAFWGGVFCVALFGASVALVGWPIHREALGVVQAPPPRFCQPRPRARGRRASHYPDR